MLMRDEATFPLSCAYKPEKLLRKDIKYASIFGRMVAMPTLVANLETRYELSAIFIPMCLHRLEENLLISRHALLSVVSKPLHSRGCSLPGLQGLELVHRQYLLYRHLVRNPHQKNK